MVLSVALGPLAVRVLGEGWLVSVREILKNRERAWLLIRFPSGAPRPQVARRGGTRSLHYRPHPRGRTERLQESWALFTLRALLWALLGPDCSNRSLVRPARPQTFPRSRRAACWWHWGPSSG